MKETKNFDKWIGILSISVICIVAIVFVVMISDTHLAKGTYSTSCYAASDPTSTFVCPTGSHQATLTIEKCCPTGTIYDGTTRKCKKTSDGTYTNTLDGSHEPRCKSGTKLYEDAYCCPEGTFNSSTKQCCPSSNATDCDNIGSEVDTDTEHCTCIANPMAGGNAGVWTCYPKPSSSSPRPSSSSSKACYCCGSAQGCTYVWGTGGPSCVLDSTKNQTQCTGTNPPASSKPNSSSCEKLDRGAGCYTCGLGTSAATTNYHVSDPDKDKCKGTERCNRVGATCAGTSTGITPTKTVVLKNAEGTSNNGSFLVDRNNNQITSYNPIKNCGTWSTTPCANSDCNTGASAQDSAYSGLGVGKTYTGPAVLYCKAGTSQDPNEPTPGNPSSTPANPSSTPGNPSSTPGNPSSTPGNPSSNPPTGATGIIIAWVIGLFAIGYSFWYFKRTSTN